MGRHDAAPGHQDIKTAADLPFRGAEGDYHHRMAHDEPIPAPPEPDPVDLWAMTDLCTPWCLHAVVTARIAEHLEAGPAAIAGLAAAAGCDPGALAGVLRHLIGRGVFAEPEPGVFALNPAARRLVDPAVRIGLDLDGIGGRMARAWATLPTYVRTGAPGYHEVFGMPFWDDLAAHPEVGASFDALMGRVGHGRPNPDVELAEGWGGVETVVDVGGGTGAMLAEILRARPGVRGTLVDLPGTAARAAETFAEAGVADRVAILGQSFFDPLPAGADLYLLRKVINDWPDREAAAILGRCAGAARPSGRVVVLGGVSEDAAAAGIAIETILVGGRQRTVDEFRRLAAAAGLDVVAAGERPSGYFVTECRPSAPA
jgi:2,7-dihydroxy-5-methyl-1-naphthoate 7-O-methyltransferase